MRVGVPTAVRPRDGDERGRDARLATRVLRSRRMSDRGHRSIEHTADLAVELWAPDEATLLVEGARALVEVLTEGAVIRASAERPLELTAIDPEDRLVRWLAEVLYLAAVEGFLVHDASLTLSGTLPGTLSGTLPGALPGASLRGTVRGQPDAESLLRTEIKAVTYHDLRLERGPAGVRARVVFDV